MEQPQQHRWLPESPASFSAVSVARARTESSATASGMWNSYARIPPRPASMSMDIVIEGGTARGTDELTAFFNAPYSFASATSGSRSKEVGGYSGGFYLVKFAVAVGAVYLAIELLIEFAEVLLPFIFAVLLMLILEPLKKCVVRILTQIFILLVTVLCLRRCCLVEVRPRGMSDVARETSSSSPNAPCGEDDMAIASPADSVERATQRPTPGASSSGSESRRGFLRGPQAEVSSNQEEESGEMSTMPIPSIQKFILTVAIIFCMAFTGQVLWLVVKAFIAAGQVVGGDIAYYRMGASRIKGWFKLSVRNLHAELINWDPLVDDLIVHLRRIAEESTSLISDLLFQIVVTFIFLLYLLWSPIKIESNSMTQEAFRSAGRFLTVKTLTSLCVGLAVFISLWVIGIPIPAAFGLLSFLLNFLPGVGSVIATLLPCGLALLDFRISTGQVLLALIVLVIIHFFFDYFIEPIIFGISAEVHSVVVILGIVFFGQIWGVPGMLISVPLMAVARLLLRSSKTTDAGYWALYGEDLDNDEVPDNTIVMLDTILEGRWMTSVSGTETITEMSIDQGDASMQLQRRVSGSQAPDRHYDPAAGPRSLWDTAAGRELCRCYQSHQLLIELTLLTIVVSLVFAAG